MTRLEGMNLEEDTKKAIGNNYTLISQRTSAAGKTNAKKENRNKILDEGDQKLTIEMQRLYQDVMDKKLLMMQQRPVIRQQKLPGERRSASIRTG